LKYCQALFFEVRERFYRLKAVSFRFSAMKKVRFQRKKANFHQKSAFLAKNRIKGKRKNEKGALLRLSIFPETLKETSPFSRAYSPTNY
jgi:hypothetical protein